MLHREANNDPSYGGDQFDELDVDAGPIPSSEMLIDFVARCHPSAIFPFQWVSPGATDVHNP